MPRDRFLRLSAQQQVKILDAAAAEFAAHDFAGASYNRIIQLAEVSKGAMYYYFEDKRDLYLAVIKRAMEELLQVFDWEPLADDGNAYWEEVESFCQFSLLAFTNSSANGTLALRYLLAREQEKVPEIERVVEKSSHWITRLIKRGQQVGAVRRDVPLDLLSAVIFNAGQAIDVWLAQAIQRDAAPESPQEVDTLPVAAFTMDLIRRIAQPSTLGTPAGRSNQLGAAPSTS